MSGGFREEVVNVRLAELLEERDIVSLPEQVVSNITDERRLPDIMTAHFWGVRTVIEGRIGQSSGVKTSLEEDCMERIQEGIAPLAVAVAYPDGIQSASSLDGLTDNIESAELEINVFTEAGAQGWQQGDVDNLANLLRIAYQELVEENVVEESVDALDGAIDDFVDNLSSTDELSGATERLREIVIIPQN
jgi:hypothetical protein